jgi:hypothetical protein
VRRERVKLRRTAAFSGFAMPQLYGVRALCSRVAEGSFREIPYR